MMIFRFQKSFPDLSYTFDSLLPKFIPKWFSQSFIHFIHPSIHRVTMKCWS